MNYIIFLILSIFTLYLFHYIYNKISDSIQKCYVYEKNISYDEIIDDNDTTSNDGNIDINNNQTT